jgi:hypothetical protein
VVRRFGEGGEASGGCGARRRWRRGGADASFLFFSFFFFSSLRGKSETMDGWAGKSEIRGDAYLNTRPFSFSSSLLTCSALLDSGLLMGSPSSRLRERGNRITTVGSLY